jgi:ABC-2 type transport system permease protein
MIHASIRFYSLCKKETLQIVRDPSTLLIAFLFPVVLMFVFGAGINLDSSVVELGVFAQDDSPTARRLVDTLRMSPYFRVSEASSVQQLGDALRAEEIQGFVVLGPALDRQLLQGTASSPSIEIVTDAAEPNGANFVAGYVRGALAIWQQQERAQLGLPAASGWSLEVRNWFNPSATSRNFLLPGSVTIIMTVIGALLTALVVAREWERGTMESLLAAGVSRLELLGSKLLPYFVLGLVSFSICVLLTRYAFDVPFRGSLLLLMGTGATFLCSALGIGLLLSTVLRNQYNAAQAALNAAFLPAMMLSGFVFEISSMPWPIRAVSSIVPARYFVTAMQTLFQAGDVMAVITRSLLGLSLASVGFLGLTLLNTRRRLE